MFWKRKPATFKQRVDKFWQWFPTVAQSYYDAIEDGRCGDLQPEMGAQVSAIWDEFQWVFGPGPVERGGHSFTVSGGGILHCQFLAHYWAEKAPELDGWTFYGSRQPGDLSEDVAIDIGGDRFDLAGLNLAPELDEERELAHVKVWHEVFAEVDERKRDIGLFLLLDEVLGEFGTDQWLGRIDVVDELPEGAIPALQFRDYLHDLEIQRGWKKLAPPESFSTYQLPSPNDAFPRSDTVVGTTSNMSLIEEWLDAEGPLEQDPLAGSGAEYVFVAFPSSGLPEGGEAAYRGDIEDRLSEAMGDRGRVLGGALGRQRVYIDMLLVDGDRSLAAVKSALKQFELPGPRELHYFAQGRKPAKL